MEFVAICAVAVFLGLRGFRAAPKTYAVCAGAALVAALYTYKAV
jgi:hypothetical protein